MKPTSHATEGMQSSEAEPETNRLNDSSGDACGDAATNACGELVEHFFRHEYGRLVSMMARALGVRHMQLAEDAVQMAMSRALQSWGRHGVPEDPSGWLYRTARNVAIDSLRRDVRFQKVALQWHDTAIAVSENADIAVLPGDVADDSLKLLFLCCHESIPPSSQVALALKLVGGFSVNEIASGFMTTPANIEKRITRAKQELKNNRFELADLGIQQLLERRPAALKAIYLLFNEGFSASVGQQVIRRDLCDEAIRLCRMMQSHPSLQDDPVTHALLALMLFHSARFATRLDDRGCIVLLDAQNRSVWDWDRIRQGMQCMLDSARGDVLSQYHIEAAIAWEHCRSPSLAETDWHKVAGLYDRLFEIAPSPMVELNCVIAHSYNQGTGPAIQRLLKFQAQHRKQLRPWWDCAMAQLLQREGRLAEAILHWKDALALTTQPGLVNCCSDNCRSP